MGGGGDSRIPSILRERFCSNALEGCGAVNVVVRTYDFDPEIAHAQITSWTEELRPALVIGESLGALHALRIVGMPHLFVSPALNTPLFFRYMAWMSVLPGVTELLGRIWLSAIPSGPEAMTSTLPFSACGTTTGRAES